MFNFDRIKFLAKEKGLSLTFITNKLGLAKCYFNTAIRENRDIPDDRLAIIADILGTTPAYLRDETDDPAQEKEKAPIEITDERDAVMASILNKYRQMSPSQREEFIKKLSLILDPSVDSSRLEAMIRLLKPDQPSDQ